jgi:hypothetical protein
MDVGFLAAKEAGPQPHPIGACRKGGGSGAGVANSAGGHNRNTDCVQHTGEQRQQTRLTSYAAACLGPLDGDEVAPGSLGRARLLDGADLPRRQSARIVHPSDERRVRFGVEKVDQPDTPDRLLEGGLIEERHEESHTEDA